MEAGIKRIKKRSINRSYIMKGYLFLLPATLIYLIFAVVPVIDNIVLSFHRWNGFSARVFIGLRNYMDAFGDGTFLLSVKNSVYIGFVSSLVSVVVGVVLAWYLLYSPKRLGSVYRTILFSPSMIPPIITALVFSFVYEPEVGVLNNLLDALELDFLKAAWLTNKGIVVNSITFVSIWKQIGLTVVLTFAGMQAIPAHLIESAYLEGAGNLRIFKDILLPLTMPFIQLSAVFALMSGLKIYDTVLALTRGGPGTYSMVMPMWIIEQSFTHNHYGYGGSMSIIFVLIVLLAMLIVKSVVKGISYEL